jgi:hypothetical protein
VGVCCAFLGLAGVVVLATDRASHPGEAGVAIGFTGFAILILNPLRWAPIRLRRAYRPIGGWALGTMLATAALWERASFAYYHMALFALALAILFPVVVYCERRHLALASAFEIN